MAAVGMLAQLHGQVAPAIAMPEPVSSADHLRCLKALEPITAGAVPASSDFSPVECPLGESAATFRYDMAQGVSRVVRNIAQDEIVPAYPEFGTSKIVPGQILRLVAVYGVVRVERQVKALQSARSGQRLFVQSGGGQIFSVRYEALAK